MLQPSAALSVPLRAAKLPNQGRGGLGMVLKQEVPAVLKHVDFRFRHVATIDFGTRGAPVRVPCYEPPRCIAWHRRVPESLDFLDLVQVGPITLGLHIVAVDKPQRG
jgi:hypothetical protein